MALDDLAPDVDEKELRGDAPLAKEEPKAEPAPEPKAEVKEEPKTEVKEEKTKFVPHEALHEERMKRKELAAKLEAKEKADADYRASIEAKLQKLFNPPAPKPDVDKEPVKALQHDIGETREMVRPLAERVERFEQNQRQAQIQAEIANRTVVAESEFIKKNADYHDAIGFLQKVTDANLIAMGVDDPVQRATQIKQNSFALAAHAIQSGKNPAEVAYQLAKNYGYQAKKAGEEEKKLETIEKGQKESKSLSGGGGTKTGGPITLEQLERMSDDEIDEIIADEKQWKKIGRLMSGG